MRTLFTRARQLFERRLHHRASWLVRAAVAAGLLVLVPGLAAASTVLYTSDAQLIAMSERVVRARVTAQRTTQAGAAGSIYTVTTLSIIEDFTSMPGDTIEVWELGGVVGNRILYVGGVPQYRIGDEVVVCLGRGPQGLRSLALGFSKFTVRRDTAGQATLSRDMTDLLVVGGTAAATSGTLESFRALAAAVTGRPVRRTPAASALESAAVSQPFTKIVGEPGWRWRDADFHIPINYYRNTAATPPVPGDAVGEILTALSAWTNPADASIILQYAGTAFELDPRNAWTTIPQHSVLITFEDPNNEIMPPVLALGGGMATIGAGGTVGGTTYDGIDTGFVLLDNSATLPASFHQSLDFTRVVTHEIGHTIGFGHTQTDGSVPNPSSNIMFASCCTTATPTPPALGPDDLVGLAHIYPAAAPSGPSMALDKTFLRFGAVTAGATFASMTSAQTVRITQSGGGTVTWTATPTQPWLHVSPASGTGPATLTLSVTSEGSIPVSGDIDGAVSLAFTGAANSPGPIGVRLTLIQNGLSNNPIGVVDTPVQNATGVTGAIPFTGWALDDVEVSRVTICRGAAGGETAPIDPNCGGTAKIFIGEGVFIDGARPDVQTALPTYPLNSRAGWGFMVLTNTLPSQGNGTFAFSIYAFDREGHVIVLGTRTMTCDNAHATTPFGTIDTPGQGETVSGSSYVNFGWALTQLPKTIPKNGSTIRAFVDGASVGTVSYDHFRADIAAQFPGLNNSNGAVGFKIIDSTSLTDGLHTIVWTATDDDGKTSGLGSRFFRVANGTGSLTVAAEAASTAAVPAASLDGLPVDAKPIVGRRGWGTAAFTTYSPNANGRVVVRGEEIDRFELRLGGGDGGVYAGYLRVGEKLEALPVGSRLDPVTGEFLWSPGVGFVGAYDFVFVRSDRGEPISRHDVRIVISPKGSAGVGPRVTIDSPRSQQDVAQPFVLSGWAADLDADTDYGSGVSTLHVWAFPLSGGAPIFLGPASMGQPRADVAAIHGSRFRESGYQIAVQGLPHGNYDLAVFAWSTATGGFIPPRVVRVTVR